ncbi:sigma-70 family RNA polymerase sigma factor [Actinomadura rudentiformis]|uniref:Sigma-70 family RNA polymerase sigma factor n=1 Tax=Actinomadura rudentiformis TaxID=359158 RepID=A0A6H9Z9X9_9ACTN|nr:sigma-70 family RNA polymerase sigma factor [Actinomadura rudentiformis]KAB2352505.1 sigma-70 family RNA polymerase sigma factor [Actinomadura rudentiformis]
MGKDEEFAGLVEPFRRELLAHCYRMMGTLDEAEDLVQETFLRAWRGYATFQGRSSLRVWLYKIATNACLSARERRSRRPLPSGLGPPSKEPDLPPKAADGEIVWLQPIPDAMVTPGPGDPAAIVTMRERLRLTLIASLQHLTPRQRAVYILREGLGFSAAEVAGMLGISVVAGKSLLQRARTGMEEVATAVDEAMEPNDPAARVLLARYMAAFENSDLDALERALRKDAALEMVGHTTWFSGVETCLRYIGHVIGAPGTWRMLPTAANGQPAAAVYRRVEDGVYQAFGVAVLAVASGGITGIVLFSEPDLLARFGMPYRLAAA